MINKSEIMKDAWRMYKWTNSKPYLFKMTFAESLKAAWADWRRM